MGVALTFEELAVFRGEQGTMPVSLPPEDPLCTAFAAAYAAGWAAEAEVERLAVRVARGRKVVVDQPQWASRLTEVEAEHAAAVAALDAAVAAYWEARCRLVAAETEQETAGEKGTGR